MNCNCEVTTENKKNTLKVRKGNTLKLKLKYTINGSPASIESFNKTRFYLINPYQIKREITNINVPRQFDDEVEISLTEDVIGRYSIEMVYRENSNTQATYDFEDVFEIVAKSSEETDITDSEFINKEVSLNGYLRVGYDDEALDRRIGDLPNFATMRSSMYILNSEVEKLKEQISTVGNGCNCEEKFIELEVKIREIEDIHIYNVYNKIDDRYLELEDKLNGNINTHYQELSRSIYNTNTRLEDIEGKIQEMGTLISYYIQLKTPPTTPPTTTQPPTTTPTPPPSDNGGNDRFDETPDNPDYGDNQEDDFN